MARFSLFERANPADMAKDMSPVGYTPEIALEGLLPGVDNLRHDVYLSPKFMEMTRTYIARLIAKYGNVEDLVKDDPLQSAQRTFMQPRMTNGNGNKVQEPGAEFKRVLTDLQVNALNAAKADGNISLDLLARLSIVKLFRIELAAQFAQVLERLRAKLKGYEGPRSSPLSMEMRDRFLKLQVAKKIVLRKAGQELFVTLREVEKETVARMRRSLFGEVVPAAYDLFMNRLLFTDEGRDDYLNAEHYVMLGNYERDPDRFATMQEIASAFLRSLELSGGDESDTEIDAWLNSPQNAQELLGAGVPEEDTQKGKAQRILLSTWLDHLEKASVTNHVLASYEAVPLLSEYSPLINPQQLKNALISKSERQRVEQLLEEHGRMSPDKLHIAVKRLGSYSNADRAKIAGRFLMDFMRYHRDLRRFEALNSSADSVNVIVNDKIRELSAINNTLYEFLLPEEQKPREERVTHHVILKADIRDSTRLTRTLFERGLNPASYFSLNFYEPVNKLLPKYGASKVFIEGDAVILAMFEREGEASFGVSRTCMLAREIIEITRAYNEHSQRGGLPVLELGIGICYHDAPPMYLMDEASRIMISPALNESDRLSSCSKAIRRFLTGFESIFNIYQFQTVDVGLDVGTQDEFVLRYNMGGIQIGREAFQKLQDEIALQPVELEVKGLWGAEKVVLLSGLVPVAGGVFHRIVIREARLPHVEPRDLSLKGWTDTRYYEVCTSQAAYDMIEQSMRRAPTQR